MFLDVLGFELNYHRRQYLIYVLSGVFFLLFFLVTTSPNVSMVGGVQNININAPFTVMASLSGISLWAIVGGLAFCTNGVTRDRELQLAEIFLSSPVGKFDYMYGRYCGALFYTIVLYVAGALGLFIGELMPWLDQERIGPISSSAYWFSTWAIALPNIIICTGLFYCVATVTRSTMATYVALIALLILNAVVDSFTEKDTIELTSMLDPFGGTALQELTRYWTVFEKNELVPVLEGTLLNNRILWTGIGIAFLAFAYPLYSFSLESGRKRKRDASGDEESKSVELVTVLTLPKTHSDFSFNAHLLQYLSQTKLEVRNIVFSIPFVVLLLIGLVSIVGASLANLGNVFGTAVYPTSGIMVAIINSVYPTSLLGVLIYYSGELMAREKALKVSEIVDATPHPNWVMMAAKFSGILLVIVAMLLAGAVAGIGVQVYKEFYEFNVSHYLVGLLWFFQLPLYFMVVLAIFFYVVTRNKYLAMFMMILYFIFLLSAPQLGFEHYLYRMSQVGTPWSDFTGYAQNLTPYLWQTLYWSLFGVLMLVATHLLWPRGSEDDWSNRVKVVRQRMSRNVVLVTWGASTLFVLTGAWIYYNTNVLNTYVTSKDLEQFQADYEKQYKQYENQPQPTISDVYAEVDIFPGERDVHLKGRYELRNISDVPISEFHVVHFAYLDVESLDIPGATLKSFDEDLGYRIYSLDEPMIPGAVMEVSFQVKWLTPGFANNGHGNKVTPNGTFFNSLDIFPLFGYRSAFELQNNNTRREHDLPPLERMARIDDEEAWMRVGFASPKRVHFETIVSTSPEQVAVAPGYLQKEWMEDGRHYFHYKMDEPIWNFYSYLSGEYELKEDSWNDIAIEVYYLHDYNVDTMIRSTKNSLDYFERNFSPYQYRQFRILEFPRYQGAFAQSFPNTIPFSEAIGFVADLRDPEEIDYVYYVTAHELAHQWWAHQVLGADVQGQTMIVETLAQYSALMVMEEEYGEDHMKRFLEFELDSYLSGRGGELIDEMPLFLVENQPYIHYRKGSVVLYALKDYIGEEEMNRALSNFIDEYAFKGPPYPTTRHLIAHIREQAPDEYDDFITDLLEKIVLFDLKVAESSVTELEDGRYEVTLDVTAQKFEADGAGRESEVPIDGWFDIGVLGEEQGDAKVPEVLHLQKYEITANEQSFTIVVDKKPISVGIDPFNKLIDRNPSDNVEKI
jgi:hypothetical protein